MGEQRHTPGPWTTRTDGWQPWEGAILILGPDGQIIAYTSAGTNEKADAPLLAAAPDLVKALEVARRYIDGVIINTPDKKKKRNFGDCLRIIDEALAKVSQS